MSINFERLFKLRAAVGRFGEMDAAGWWNTQGVLGARGAAVFKRGLPETHLFARARVVARVAEQRTQAVYPAPGVATLWSLPPAVERGLAFQERKWAATETARTGWSELGTRIQSPAGSDLADWLIYLGLVDPVIVAGVASLKDAPGGKATQVPGRLNDETIQLLAAAHARGGPKQLVVPFIQDGLEAAVE